MRLIEESHKVLEPKGKIFIIHPVKNFRDYIDDGFGGIALDHLGKRLVNDAFNRLLSNHQYRYYSPERLEEICSIACPDAKITLQFSPRPAYTFLTIEK